MRTEATRPGKDQDLQSINTGHCNNPTCLYAHNREELRQAPAGFQAQMLHVMLPQVEFQGPEKPTWSVKVLHGRDRGREVQTRKSNKLWRADMHGAYQPDSSHLSEDSELISADLPEPNIPMALGPGAGQAGGLQVSLTNTFLESEEARSLPKSGFRAATADGRLDAMGVAEDGVMPRAFFHSAPNEPAVFSF